ncbi:hypothetical protein V2A60_005869 [Cordyceps javanica]
MSNLQKSADCGFSAGNLPHRQMHPQGIYYTEAVVHQPHGQHGEGPGHLGPFPGPPLPDSYQPAYATHAPAVGQVPIFQDACQRSRYPPNLPMSTTGRATLPVEKSYSGDQTANYPIQQVSLHDHRPPPAYRRDEYEQPYPYPSFPAGTVDYQRPAVGPANQLGDAFKLIAIPATSAKLGSPFLRAYPPALEFCGISRPSFIQFIDRLNRAAVASPPIQVLGLAGNIVGFVPLHTAQIVGNAVNLAAKVSTVAVSKGRTEMLLKEANNTMFKAAGLEVQVAKLDVVAKLGQIPILDQEGKVNKNSSILLPFDGDEHDRTMNAHERRVQALATWLSPLDVESLPELDEANNVLGRMHAKVSERQRQKEEAKVVKDRNKMYKSYAKDRAKEDGEYWEKMREYNDREARIQEKGGRRMEKELQELRKKREKLTKEHDKEVGKIEKERRKDDKEEESMRKILFLVIRRK